jgi:hypothetical protein
MKANVSYQNLGTNWLVILNGNENDVELAFNSFYNHGATSGELDWNATYNATFWSTPAKMRTYFFNRMRHISLSIEQEEAIEARAYKFIVKHLKPKTPWEALSKVRHVANKMIRRLLHSTVTAQFNEFKEGSKTDWNKKFGITDYHEYAVGSTKNDANRDPDDFRDYMVTRSLKG